MTEVTTSRSLVDYQDFFESPCYALSQSEKEQKLLPALKALTQHHRQQCILYADLLNAYAIDPDALSAIEQLPALSVRLFKVFELRSITAEDIFKTLMSSGTTGQAVSKIYLDQYVAHLQARALVKILQSFIGVARLPMLIVDTESTTRSTNVFSARAAGIRGLATFGRDHTYLLDDNLDINFERLYHFLEKHSAVPILIFGFTFLVWQHLFQQLKKSKRSIDLSQAILIHSGGWKKMLDQAVDNHSFKANLRALTGLTRVHNFYGMVEQVGSVFMECEAGYLHAPVFADILIMDIIHNRAQPVGVEGVIQVLSILPESYPGHVLLTEDLGTIWGVDDCVCGRKGKYFTVSGRIPMAEMRGCGDVQTEKVAAS